MAFLARPRIPGRQCTAGHHVVIGDKDPWIAGDLATTRRRSGCPQRCRGAQSAAQVAFQGGLVALEWGGSVRDGVPFPYSP